MQRFTASSSRIAWRSAVGRGRIPSTRGGQVPSIISPSAVGLCAADWSRINAKIANEAEKVVGRASARFFTKEARTDNQSDSSAQKDSDSAKSSSVIPAQEKTPSVVTPPPTDFHASQTGEEKSKSYLQVATYTFVNYPVFVFLALIVVLRLARAGDGSEDTATALRRDLDVYEDEQDRRHHREQKRKQYLEAQRANNKREIYIVQSATNGADSSNPEEAASEENKVLNIPLPKGEIRKSPKHVV